MTLRTHGRSGVTLIELVLATSLAAIVVASLVSVSRTAVEIWSRGETSRDAREVAHVALDSIARDLRQVHSTAEGDLLADWAGFDIERDGVFERLWPRLRFVRDISPAEISAIGARRIAEAARLTRLRRSQAAARAGMTERAEEVEALDQEELAGAMGVTAEDLARGAAAPAPDLSSTGLAEILYAVVPVSSEGPERFVGSLVRAERLHVPGTPLRLMDAGAFDRRGAPMPEAGALELVRGVLWLEPLFATQTTRVRAGQDGAQPWRVSDSITGAATSWDAWRRGRPDEDLTTLNEPAAGMSRRGDAPILPRSVRLEIEVLQPGMVERAPTISRAIDPESTSLEISSARLISEAKPTFVLVGSEWMRVTKIRRTADTLIVTRAQRGTAAVLHAAGTKVLFGESSSIEIPVPLHQGDWGLDEGEWDGRSRRSGSRPGRRPR